MQVIDTNRNLIDLADNSTKASAARDTGRDLDLVNDLGQQNYQPPLLQQKVSVPPQMFDSSENSEGKE